jgi:hydrogenase-4 component F
MTALTLVLMTPLLGAVLFAFIGHRRQAGLVNVGLSTTTFASALWLAYGVLRQGPLLSPGEQLYVDVFNAYLVVLMTFIGLTTAIFSRPYRISADAALSRPISELHAGDATDPDHE